MSNSYRGSRYSQKISSQSSIQVELRVLSKKQTLNFKAKMVHGNIKRGILNIHVNIRSLYNKMSEVKNLIVKEKPHIHGISEAELRKACHKKSLQFEQKPALQDPQVQSIWAGFKNMKKKHIRK